MPRLHRLPALTCWLLCLLGATASSGAAWVRWLGLHSPTLNPLKLADLDPDREVAHLTDALAQDPRNLSALLRLTLHAEFQGNLTRSALLLAEATRFHHSYKSYMAALGFASRRNQPESVQRLAALAFQFCPGDADGIYMLLGPVSPAQTMIPPARQADYFRFLLGQNRLDEALQLQTALPPGDEFDRHRLALSERFMLNREFDTAASLFTRFHPDFQTTGQFNLHFETQPLSLAFDWRLTQNPAASLHWRPAELEVDIGVTTAPLEVVSIFLAARSTPKRRAFPMWSGQTRGLVWELFDAAPGWHRLALTAPAGPMRRFKLTGMRLE